MTVRPERKLDHFIRIRQGIAIFTDSLTVTAVIAASIHPHDMVDPAISAYTGESPYTFTALPSSPFIRLLAVRNFMLTETVLP